MLKKGPEIKMPDLKVPDFLFDIYYDLRERHLLPLVALLLVAIVAAPIVLSQSEGSEGGEEEVPIATPSTAPSGAGELIARSAPGLRDYRRRLGDRSSTDPFRAQASSATATEATASSSAESSPSTSSTPSLESSTPEPSSTPPVESTGSTPSPGPQTQEPAGKDDLTYFSYAIDVRVTSGGSPDEPVAKPKENSSDTRRNLPELTMLPSRETPAFTYMGATKDGKKALFMISSNVQSIFGDGVCALGSKTCELLAVEPGLPQTVVYGPQARTFKIELLKIHLVQTDELNRAPLGKPNAKKGNDQPGPKPRSGPNARPAAKGP